MTTTTAQTRIAGQTQAYKKAEPLAKGLGAAWFEYDPELFGIVRIETFLGEKHVFPAMGTNEKQTRLRGRMPFKPYANAQDHSARNGENNIPVEIFIYNDDGIGFVEISTDPEFAGHPKYVSLVGKLCDSRAKARLDNYAMEVLRPSRLMR